MGFSNGPDRFTIPAMDAIGPQPAASHPEARCAATCGAAGPPPAATADRTALVAAAFRLEWLTVGWMVIEAIVALGAGLAAGSVVLLAFGLDSVIELLSAGVLLWRLAVELRHGQAFSEAAERLASRIGGGLLFALAGYVVLSAGWSLWMRDGAAFSVPGLVVSLLALPIMRHLARRKIALAEALGSRALRADAMESITCGWLSLVVVVSLVAQGAFGAWWVDPVGALAIVWLLVKEGREAWSGEACGCAGDACASS